MLRSAAFEPFGLEALPAIRNHLVGGGVRIGAARQLSGQETGGVSREGLAEALPVIDNRCGVFCIENGFERGAGGK